MFHRLGQITYDYRWGVIAAWLLAAAALRIAAPSWSAVALDGDLDQLPPNTTTTRAARLNAEAFPDDVTRSQLVIVFARAGEPLTPADRQFAVTTARRLESLALPLVDAVWTEETPVIGPMLKSPAGEAQRIVARLTNDFMAVDNVRVLAAVERLIDERRGGAPPGLEIGITGSAAVGGDMLAAAAESLRNTDRTTIVLVALALGLIYRSVWLIVVPLASITVAVTTSLDLLALLTQWSRNHPAAWPDVRVFTTTRIFVVVLLFGAGTDFCLFLIARFRELRADGTPQREALIAAVGHVGHAITASAATTIAGLAMMGFADFGKFAYSGPSIALSLTVALAVCLTLTPALLATRLGSHVPSSPQDAASGGWQGFWTALADRVVARPGMLLAVSVLIAAPLAWHGWQTSVTYDIFSELSPDTVSRRGTALLRKHFPPGENGPLTVLAKLPEGGLLADDGRFKIAELNKVLHELPGVDKVRSLYRPTGDAPGQMSLSVEGFSGLIAANSPLAKETFVAQLPSGEGDVTRLALVLDDEPFSAAAVATAARVEQALQSVRDDRQSAWHGATFEMLGPTSGVRDLERITLADRRRIEVLVAAAVLVVILILLRRPVVCLYLIFTVLVSYFVTLGGVDLLFHALHGAGYPGLDWKVPLFLFVILVAVGQDYNIYLVTRVVEEQRNHGPIEGLRRAITQTGGIITSCGVIMAATFASMITGSLRGMVELGTALSLGILLDTFVVRTALVPAFLALISRRGVKG